MRPGRTSLALMLAFTAIGTAPAAAVSAQPPTLAGIEDEVMCTVCGVPLSMAREAPAAKRERALIAELIAEGKSKEQIKETLVATYGTGVLAVPTKKGFDLVAWIVPLVALAAGLALLAALAVAWRRRRPQTGNPGPTGTVSELDADDAARVEAALAEDR
jgi:cytochrome c-type biogenesis protein CcmH